MSILLLTAAMVAFFALALMFLGLGRAASQEPPFTSWPSPGRRGPLPLQPTWHDISFPVRIHAQTGFRRPVGCGSPIAPTARVFHLSPHLNLTR